MYIPRPRRSEKARVRAVAEAEQARAAAQRAQHQLVALRQDLGTDFCWGQSEYNKVVAECEC